MQIHDDLLILQLSDLHFGNKSRYSDLVPEKAAELGRRFFKAIKQACTELNIQRRIDLVIVSGDIVETGKPSEFLIGHEFLQALAGEIGIEQRRFVFVPGNHDVSWAECKKVDTEIEGEELPASRRREELDSRKLRAYDTFVSHFYSRKLTDLSGCRQLTRGGWIHDFVELKLSVAALNSCEKESHDKGDHIGLVSSDQAQSLLNAWTETAYDSQLKLLVVHHNPVVTTDANIATWRTWLLNAKTLDEALIARYEADVTGLEGSNHLKQISDGTLVQLVLHGHHHETGQPVGWRTLGGATAWVLSTGSWGLRQNELPGDQPAACQLLRFHLGDAPRLFAHRLAFDPLYLLRGEVAPAHFRLSELSSHNDGLKIDIPQDFRPSAQQTEVTVTSLAPELSRFVSEYRKRMSGRFDNWDLRPVGTTQSGGAREAVVARLDDMYLPLRFARDVDLNKTEIGKPLDIGTLLARQAALPKSKSRTRRKTKGGRKNGSEPVGSIQPIAIRAAAGSGKTTWMRYTFRALLKTERAFPLMIVLRDVAARWKNSETRSVHRSIDQHLDDSVAELLGTGWQGRVRQLLEASKQAQYSGPRIVLLVDGWDELGDFGHEFREKLEGFRCSYPELLVVVSSRPYGDQRPNLIGGYEEVVIQPLSDSDIEQLARNFFTRCYQLEPSIAHEEWHKFSAALKRSPESEALARTALLLTMMLLISRSESLPDKRHQLYDRCIHNLLTALPQTRADGGALDLKTQWRPEDSDERRRVVARLAFDLQNSGYESKHRGAIVSKWDALTAMLPSEWMPLQRNGFIDWLAGPSGVLTDRADGTVVFSHLSFQEFLAAWHLKATHGSSLELATAFETRIENNKWWETLLLCGALVAAESQDRMDAVIARLFDVGYAGLSLAGMLLADGIGTSGIFERWCTLWIELVCRESFAGATRCASAWRGSRQESRRQSLRVALQDARHKSRWFGWYQLSEWQKAAGFNEVAVLPVGLLSRAAAAAISTDSELNERTCAVGRIWAGAVALWPTDDFVGCLQLWPGVRRLIGRRLQVAAEAGASYSDLVAVLTAIVANKPPPTNPYFPSALGWFQTTTDKKMRDILESIRQDIMPVSYSNAKSGPSFVSNIPVTDDYAFHLALQDSKEVAELVFLHWFEQELVSTKKTPMRNTIHDEPHPFIRLFAPDTVQRFLRHFCPHLVGINTSKWETAFAITELSSINVAFPRSTMARIHSSEGPLRALAIACQESLSPGRFKKGFKIAMTELNSSLDPLWGSLARHLARQSHQEDQKLLQSLAAHPEFRKPPLSWGLKYIVRGDVMLDTGEVVTLDELTDQANLPRLSYLEDIAE